MKEDFITIDGQKLYQKEMLYAKEIERKALNIVLLDGQEKLVFCKAKDLWNLLGTRKTSDTPVKGQYARLEEYIINLAQVAYIDVKRHKMSLTFARLGLEHVELSFVNDRGFRAIAKAVKDNKEIIDHHVNEDYRCLTKL